MKVLRECGNFTVTAACNIATNSDRVFIVLLKAWTYALLVYGCFSGKYRSLRKKFSPRIF